MELSTPKTIRAPELDGGLAWLNTDHPLSIRELRGSVVVLDFWTYCCINCMHVAPTLRAIEQRFAGEPLVVIGVHSGKFSAERDPDRIREAIGRYDVQHPVVVDDNMGIWSRYAIRSWPTLVIIRPDGTIAAVAPGEPELETLDAFLRREIELAREKGTLAEAPLVLGAPSIVEHFPLLYPGKASVLEDGRVVVSDSGHHRILVLSPSGDVVFCVGSGLRGLVDGAFETAAFDDPQGTAWFEGALYVADTRNHAIRRVDFDARTVTTVAGTGDLGVEMPKGRAAALDTALRSPWDLCPVGDALYVAMAGSHQLFRYFPSEGVIEVYAGTGTEALIDGDVARSAWAQPSGLAAKDGRLYVADSETSAVRVVDLEKGVVSTLVGQGLFDFGDDEGDAEDALLQHGLGVATFGDALLIADTYNGKIKRLDFEGDRGRITTVLGDLDEPGSIVVAPDGSWIIADTNAHRIVRFADGKSQAIALRGAPVPQRGTAASKPRPTVRPPSIEGWFTSLLELPEGVGLSPGDASIVLALRAPDGTELSAGAPIRARFEVSRRSDLLVLARSQQSVEAIGGASQAVTIAVRVTSLPEASIDAELVVTLDYVACAASDHAACFPRTAHARVPVRLLAEGGARTLDFPLPLATLDRP